MENEEHTQSDASDLPAGVEDELREKHGKLITFTADGFGPFAFKRATQATHDKLVNQLSDSKEKSQAIRTFVLNCMVFPRDTDSGKPTYSTGRALFEAMPAAPSDLAEAIQELPGKLNLKKR